jgi:hypothetical protein
MQAIRTVYLKDHVVSVIDVVFAKLQKCYISRSHYVCAGTVDAAEKYDALLDFALINQIPGLGIFYDENLKSFCFRITV